MNGTLALLGLQGVLCVKLVRSFGQLCWSLFELLLLV